MTQSAPGITPRPAPLHGVSPRTCRRPFSSPSGLSALNALIGIALFAGSSGY